MQPEQQGPPPAPGWTPPEGPSGPRAGFWRRFGAALVDGFLLSFAGNLIAQAFGYQAFTVQDGTLRYELEGWPFILSLALQIGYYVILEGSAAGQTLGKKLVGIRVIDFSSGGPIGRGRAFVRWIARFASALPCLLGYFWMLWDKQKQTWHDKISTSLVVPEDAYPRS